MRRGYSAQETNFLWLLCWIWKWFKSISLFLMEGRTTVLVLIPRASFIDQKMLLPVGPAIDYVWLSFTGSLMRFKLVKEKKIHRMEWVKIWILCYPGILKKRLVFVMRFSPLYSFPLCPLSVPRATAGPNRAFWAFLEMCPLWVTMPHVRWHAPGTTCRSIFMQLEKRTSPLLADAAWPWHARSPGLVPCAGLYPSNCRQQPWLKLYPQFSPRKYMFQYNAGYENFQI